MIAYDKSAKGAIITYTSPLFTSPALITAAGIQEWFTVDDAEGAVMEAACDNTLSTHVKPVFVKGKITLQPLAPALSAIFIPLMQRQQAIGASILGTLTVTLPNELGIITYNNFLVTSVFKGFELAEMIKDVPIHFSSETPNSTILGDLLSIGEAILGLI